MNESVDTMNSEHDSVAGDISDTNLEQLLNGNVADMAKLLDKLSQSASDPWDLLQKLGECIVNRGEGERADRGAQVHHIERALAYTYTDDPRHAGATIIGVCFSSANDEWPPQLDSVTDKERRVWEAVAGVCKEPLPRVHLLDVTFSSRRKGTPEEVSMIVELYREVSSKTSIDSYYRAACLRRAWSLARSFGLSEMERLVRRDGLNMVSSQLGVGPIVRSALIQLFEFLTVKPKDGWRVEADRLKVRNALREFRSCVIWSEPVAEEVTKWIVRIADSESERDEARRVMIEGFLEVGGGETGMLASYWYERAASEAKRYHYNDLHGRAVSCLQSHPVSENDMQVFSVDKLIPRYVVDHRLARYRQSNDVLTAVDIWLMTPSPTGSHERNLESARRLTEGHLLSVVTSTIYNQYGLPVRTAGGLEESIRQTLERLEIMNSYVYGNLLANELMSIRAFYGVPSKRTLVDRIVSTYRCDAKLVESLIEAILSFWEERYFESGSRAYPLVEAGMRSLLLALDVPIYRIATGDSEGKFPSLETYAKMLEKIEFDNDWLRCLRNPISKWRNDLAHGHRLTLLKEEAAVLLRVAALLVTLVPTDGYERSVGIKELQDPVAWVSETNCLRASWMQEWILSWGCRPVDDSPVECE